MAMRLYEQCDAGKDGYPLAWHESIKHAVREQAGYRCVRCGHPYRGGEHGNGEWTHCDARCTHGGPYRFRADDGGWLVEIHDRSAGSRVSEGREVEAAWRILTVHHLDGDKLNCRWWNLAALCQRCHLSIQGRVIMDRPWLFEHSDWFKPYVAGYYAFTRLGEDLTRDEVTARMEELLTLGIEVTHG